MKIVIENTAMAVCTGSGRQGSAPEGKFDLD
jgi:hypothetical protein